MREDRRGGTATSKLAVLLVVLGSGALSAALSLALRPEPTPAAPPPAAGPDRDLRELEQRLAALEQRADVARADVAPAAAPRRSAAATREHVDASLLAALAARVARLENDARVRAAPRAPAPEPPIEAESAELTLAGARSTILDPAAGSEEKVLAHRRLRRVPDAYTPEMVAELVRLGTSDARDDVRARVWCYFDGSSHLPGLVPHLLRAVAYDPAAHARDEAAETLGNYADDPGVLAALRHAAARDVAARVRSKAARTLAELETGASRR